MTRTKKTAPRDMSPQALVTEHETLDDLISTHQPKMEALSELGFGSVAAAKSRRVKVKTQLQALMNQCDPDPQVLAYAKKRQWDNGSAIVSV